MGERGESAACLGLSERARCIEDDADALGLTVVLEVSFVAAKPCVATAFAATAAGVLRGSGGVADWKAGPGDGAGTVGVVAWSTRDAVASIDSSATSGKARCIAGIGGAAGTAS